MKGFLLLVAVLLGGFSPHTEQESRKIAQGSVTTRQGLVLNVGDRLRFGEGKMDNKAYRHAFTALRHLDKPTAHLDEGYAYTYATIRELRETGTGGNRRLLALVKPKGDLLPVNKVIDLEPALEAKEIISVNDVAVYTLLKRVKK